MAKKYKQTISQETQDEAMAMAKKVQKPGQTKEQTKLIALGIQKGIAEYKKQAKNKQRNADKARKKKTIEQPSANTDEVQVLNTPTPKLPWVLLGLSWMGFVAYLLFIHSIN